MNPKLNHPLLLKHVSFDRLLVCMNFGSTVYGTALPTSDTDFKGLMLPVGRQIVLGTAPSTQNIHTNDPGSGTRNTVDDLDMELFSVYRYLELLSQGQTVALDMLFCPPEHIQMKTGVWDHITENRHKFINKKCGAAIGYAKAQANKYSLRGFRMSALEYVLDKLEQEYRDHPHRPLSFSTGLAIIKAGLPLLDPTVASYITFPKEIAPHLPTGQIEYIDVCGKKAGYGASVKFAYEVYKNALGDYGDRARAARDGGADWKAMYHAVRIAEQTVELLDTGHITFPRPEAPYLLQVRRGERDVVEVSAKIEEGITRILEAQARSTLPEKTDAKAIEELTYKLYLSEIVRDARANGYSV